MNDSRARGLSRLADLRLIATETQREQKQIASRFERLAEGKTVAVSSHNLFQTPRHIAERMADMVSGRDSVLEPSAGLGRIYRALRASDAARRVTLVDISPDCCRALATDAREDRLADIIQGDFLSMTPARLGMFAAVVANPPFKNGEDVKHIMHALQFLQPGGVLVSLCFNGTRQNSKLRPVVDSWEDLPPNCFASEGTRAEVALVTIVRQ